ncbi:hypothetical protein ACR56S_04395 [Staphylococcus hominis]
MTDFIVTWAGKFTHWLMSILPYIFNLKVAIGFVVCYFIYLWFKGEFDK